tara:strand:+ start:11351 stop:12295 length:945 start_codon:yes stop_codon:yes gene_type:complete
MAFPNDAGDFNQLLSTTLYNYRDQLVDNIFKAHVLLDHLNTKGRVLVEEGGVSIVEPVLYEANSTAEMYAGYDVISLTPQEGISAANYEWKQVAASIAISGIEEAKNRGKEQVIKLLNAKITQAEQSIQELMNGQLFSGTGSGENMFGISKIAGTLNNVVGNIDAATETWWNPQVTNVGGALDLVDMGTLYNDASKGNDVPDIIVTTQTQYEAYENLLTPLVRYQDVAKANAGFQNLMFKQTPVVFDKVCTAGNMYFLNSKYLKLTGMSGNWFNTTPFQNGVVNGVDARYALILAYGALTCSARLRQGALTGLT